jgi:hypothetical protein
MTGRGKADPVECQHTGQRHPYRWVLQARPAPALGRRRHSGPNRTPQPAPVRPFLPAATGPALSAQHAAADLLDVDNVRGKRPISRRLHRNVTIREENATAVLEVPS